MTRSVEIPDKAVLQALAQIPRMRRVTIGEMREALVAALPYLAPAGDGGLREALQTLVDEWRGSEPTEALYDALGVLLAAHPAAPAPVVTDNAAQEAVMAYNAAWRWRRDHPAALRVALEAAVPLLAPAVPQPVDREALEAKLAAAITATDLMGCGCCTGSYDYDKYESREDALAAALAAVLAGEQEQVEK